MTKKTRTTKQIAMLVLLLSASFTLRLFYMSEIASGPFFNNPIQDAQIYNEMATRYANSGTLWDGPFYQPPLYPLFLGKIYSIFGNSKAIPRLVQIILGVCNLFILFLIAEKLFTFNWSIVVCAIYAIWGPSIFFEGELLSPTLIVFWNLNLVLQILLFYEKRRFFNAGLAGIFFGASAITSPMILPYGIIIIALLIKAELRPKHSWRSILLPVAGFVFGVAATILPVTLRNASYNQFVLISYNGGINFFLGSGENYETKLAIYGGQEWDTLFNDGRENWKGAESDNSKHFYVKGLNAIGENPIGAIAATARKLCQFAHGYEIPRNQNMYAFRKDSVILSTLLHQTPLYLPYGLLFPIFCLGIVWTIQSRNERWIPIALLCLTHICILLTFFVTARYRTNILPFMILIACFAMQKSISFLREAPLWKTVLVGIGLLVLTIAVNLPISNASEQYLPSSYYNLGVSLFKKQQYNEAARSFMAALDTDPKNENALVYVGIIQQLNGEFDKALVNYNEALKIKPSSLEARYHKADLLLLLHRIEDAKMELNTIHKAHPTHQPTLYLLNKISKKNK